MKKSFLTVTLALLSLSLATITPINQGLASTLPRVFVDPQEIRDPSIEVGNTFTIKINVSNVQNLYGWQINMTFNPSVINTTAASIVEGPFLQQAGATMLIGRKIDNNAGYILVGYMLKIPFPAQGASGNGTLAYITFNVRAVNVTPLQFVEGTKLNTVSGGNLVPIEHTRDNGAFDNRKHDVAVTKIESSHIAVMPGVQVTANVTVANLGDFIETFNVTAYYNESIIETQRVIDMQPYMEKALIFAWNTSGVHFGKYVLKAKATIVEGDYDTGNNEFVDGAVTVAETVTVFHNVAVADLVATPNSVKLGQQISIDVTVANEGNFTENFEVTVYYNNTSIKTKSVTGLASGASETITIAWNTSGVNPGTYVLKAVASTVAGENKTDDNTFIGDDVIIQKLDIPPPANATFLYIVTAVIIVAVATTAFYFIKMKKPRP